MKPTVYERIMDICPDCLIAYSNGADAVEGRPESSPPVLALMPPFFAMSPDERDHECEGHFSWKPCDGCGDPLGGSRYCMSVVWEEK